MQIEIPRAALNIEDKFSICFKAADSIEKEDDIMDYYVSGDSVPLGRLAFSYTGKTVSPGKIIGSNSARWIVLIIFTLTACICIIFLGLSGKKEPDKSVKNINK